MLTKKKNAIWGRYPCCDFVNNAIRYILSGDTDRAISELLTAITKAGGYVHKDIEEKANSAHNRVWAGKMVNSMEVLIRKIELVLIAEGQNDSKFQWGEKIRYTPHEVAEILRKHADELTMKGLIEE